MRYYCIADEATVRGFRLVGISGQAVSNPVETATALQLAISRPEVGIIIFTEQVAENIRGQIEAIRREQENLLILEIPGPDGSLSGHKTLLQWVQEAVGIRINFQEAN